MISGDVDAGQKRWKTRTTEAMPNDGLFFLPLFFFFELRFVWDQGGENPTGPLIGCPDSSRKPTHRPA